MDSNFFFPVTLHQDGISITNVASWVSQLPISPPANTAVVTLYTTEGTQVQGMYLYDTFLTRWRYLIPYENVCEAIIQGASLDLYYQVETEVTPPAGTTIWRNGVLYSGTEILTTASIGWAVLTPPSGGGGGSGTVQSVNEQTPDAQGNVTLTAEDSNDASGISLIVDNGTTDGTFTFKTLVAGTGIVLSADANGNIEIASSDGGVSNAISVYEYTATGGETTFPISFAPGSVVEFFRNGGILLTEDYSTSGGVGPVILNVAANEDDDIKIIVTQPFEIANTVPTTGGAYTGLVSGITPSPGDNSASFATTAFVQNALSSISASVTSVNGMTGAVELTVSNISGAAPLASPTFTGTPEAPTATAGTNTTQIATTAYVVTALSAYATSASLSAYALLASPVFTGTPEAPTATAGTNTTQIATTAFVTTAVSGVTGAYAPLASPAFTGTPTAPTPAAGTDNTDIATTAFVSSIFAAPPAYGSTTPAAVFATTLSATGTVSGAGFTTLLAQYAPLASPTFTGTPEAPTATAGTDTTQIATTAFVTTAVSGVTGSYAPLASPAFTGTPTAPTATAGTDTTQLATTGFVYNATQVTESVALTSANVTLSAVQYGNAIIDFTGALTANIVVTFPATGQWTLFNNTTGAYTVTVSNGSGATFAVPQGATTEAISSGSTGMLPSSSASPVRFQSPAYSYGVTALASAATQTLNLGTATEFTMTITAATTIAFTNTLLAGTSEVVYIRFTNAGSAAITWPTGTQFAGGTAPTFTTSGIDLVGVKYDSTSATYFVFVIGLNMQT